MSRTIGAPVELTHLFEDEYNSVVFAVQPEISAVLRTSSSCTIHPTLNIRYGGTGVFYLDKMGFSDSIE
jgi:hypothetical protein